MTTTNSTEQALVASAIKGDREALAALWAEHRRWVAAILLVYKPRNMELEDLLQEVAMTMVSRISMLRDAMSLRPWLRTVAMNAARAAARGRAVREPAASLEEETLGATNGFRGINGVSQPEEFARVQAAVASLPELYREPLILRTVQGLRTRHVAQILGIDEAAVDTRVSRARRMIREMLGEKQSEKNSVPRKELASAVDPQSARELRDHDT